MIKTGFFHVPVEIPLDEAKLVPGVDPFFSCIFFELTGSFNILIWRSYNQ